MKILSYFFNYVLYIDEIFDFYFYNNLFAWSAFSEQETLVFLVLIKIHSMIVEKLVALSKKNDKFL